MDIRNFKKERDIENFVKFYNLATVDFPEYREITVDIANQHVFNAEYEEESHFLAIESSKIIGSLKGYIYAEKTGIIPMIIMPEHRHTGVEDLLYDSITKYFESTNIQEYSAMVYSKFDKLINFYLDKGFHVWKTGYAMKCELGPTLAAFTTPDNYSIESPDFDDEKETVLQVLDMGFDTADDTTGLLEEFRKVSKEDWFDPAGVIAAKKNGKIVGVCISCVHPARPETGFVGWLAVLKEHRHQGLGKALLMATLNWLKSKGATESQLNVDLEVPDAVNLYTNCGYEVISETKNLKKSLSNK